jgi:hypothetical protein
MRQGVAVIDWNGDSIPPGNVFAANWCIRSSGPELIVVLGMLHWRYIVSVFFPDSALSAG